MSDDVEIVSDRNGDESVGLIRFTGDLDGHGSVGADVDLISDLVDQCREMGWDKVELYLREDHLILAHEFGEDHHGLFAALAPVLPDEEDEDGDDG